MTKGEVFNKAQGEAIEEAIQTMAHVQWLIHEYILLASYPSLYRDNIFYVARLQFCACHLEERTICLAKGNVNNCEI